MRQRYPGRRPGAEPGPRGQTGGGSLTAKAFCFRAGRAEPRLWRQSYQGAEPEPRILNTQLEAWRRTGGLGKIEPGGKPGRAAAWPAEFSGQPGGAGSEGAGDGARAGQRNPPNILPQLLNESIVTQRAVASHVNLRQACFLLREVRYLSGIISKVPNANGILEKMLVLKMSPLTQTCFDK